MPQRMQEVWRERIRTGVIIDRLNRIALGKIKKAPIAVQMSTAMGLLRKTMPDMKHVENSGGRSLDEILLAVAMIAKDPPPDHGWVLPSEPPPPWSGTPL